MPLVSAYSATLGGGSAIILIPTAAFDSIVSCIIAFCSAVIAADVAIGANGWFHVASSFVSLAPAFVAAAVIASNRSGAIVHTSAFVISSTSRCGRSAAA